MPLIMKFPGHSIVPQSLKNIKAENGKTVGFGFDIKLRYYRGHYLSCTEQFELKIDDQLVDPAQITLGINDKEFPVKQLPELISEFWQVLEPARVVVHQLGGLTAGEHKIDLTFMLRSPYMPNPDPNGPNRYVPIDNSDAASQTL